MKRIFITVAVATAALFSANAQELKFGAKAGVNFSTFSVSDQKETILGKEVTTKFNTGYRTGFHVGAFVEYGISDVLFLEGGFAYNNIGATLKSVEESAKIGGETRTVKTDLKDASFILNTINVPLWVKYDIAGFRPKVGLNLGYLLNVKAKNENTTTTYDDLEKRFDLGLGLGAEYNLPMGLFFDATFNIGLLNLASKSETESGIEIKNRVFQIGVGYKF
jgi:hypothetical protein